MSEDKYQFTEAHSLKSWQTNLANFFGTVIGRALEFILDIVGKAIKPVIMPHIDKLLEQPDIPDDVKEILNKIKTTDGQWQAVLLGGMGGTAVGGVSSSVLGPFFERINQHMSSQIRQFVFDYPFVLSAWLRGLEFSEDIFNDLRKRGWHEDRIELIKQLLWLRLDPLTVQQIWLRDPAQYDHLWQDLHDLGWDDERIEVYKTLTQIIPGASDLIRMAVREVFTPEIVQKYGQMEDFPPDFAMWGAKVGLSEFWATNYWAAHWDLPSATQGFEMLHRGVITYDELKVLLRALDVMPYWRDKLIEIAYSPYTRVDIRRMYKVKVLEEADVKKAYMDLGYDEERAQNLTEFTIKTYARPEDAVEDEEEKIRELTRSDICDGYRRGILTAAESTSLLAKIHYTPESIQFYLEREDLKKEEALKDAYATNYRQLYVTGVTDSSVITSEMVDLGFLPGEVNEYLRLWYIEKIRRQARPSRTDLARFLKKGIITEEIWRAAMADHGYADQYIDWYRLDMED